MAHLLLPSQSSRDILLFLVNLRVPSSRGAAGHWLRILAVSEVFSFPLFSDIFAFNSASVGGWAFCIVLFVGESLLRL